MDVVQLAPFLKRNPRHIGEPEMLYKGDLQVQIPLRVQMQPTHLYWGETPLDVVRFDKCLSGGTLPFYYSGPQIKLRRFQGSVINCDVWIFRQHYRDTSHQVGVFFQWRWRLRNQNLPQLRVVHKAPVTFPDHEVLEQYPLPEGVDGRIVILRKLLVDKRSLS